MFVIEVPYFDLDQIYNSGQVPRWIKLRDGKYVVQHQDKVLKIEQQKKNKLLMSCNDQEFFEIWYEYFDLRTDYMEVNHTVQSKVKKFKVPARRGNGIHIINQDQFELYVYCKLIQFVGYEKAKDLMNKIAEKYGTMHKQAMREAGRVTWYEWPSPEQLLEQLDREEVTGKLKRFLRKLSDAIVNHDYAFTHNGNELFELLGRHKLESFPVIGIEETIEKNFECDVDEFKETYLENFEYAGIAYLYVLHHISNPPREVKLIYGFGR